MDGHELSSELAPQPARGAAESAGPPGSPGAEERYRLIVDSVRDYAILMLDAEGHVETWNAGAQAIKGYAAEEIAGRHISSFYTPEDRAAGRPQRLLAAAAAEGRVEDEGWRVRKDGSRFWADVVITALRDPDGRLLGFCKVTRDLTERRRAEVNARRLAEERGARQASEASLAAMRFLVEASKALSATLEYETVLRVVARLVVPRLGDNCVVDVVEADGTIRRAAEAAADPEKERTLRELRRFPPGPERPSPVIEALRTGRMVFIPRFDQAALDGLTAGEEYTRLVRRIAPRSSVTVPLRSRDRVLGAITFGMAESGRAYDERDLELAEELGRRAGAALDNALLYRGQVEATARTKRLQRVTAALAQAGSAEEAGRVVVHHALEAFGAATGAVYVLDRGRDEVRCVAAATRHPGRRRPRPLSAAPPLAAPGGGPAYLTTRDDLLARYPGARSLAPWDGAQALMSLSLRVNGEAIGSLLVAFSEPRGFGEEERRFAEALADQCAQAVDRARLQELRDRFLGILGHDLRNPLNAIVMSADGLLRHDLPEPMGRPVRRIAASGARMERLISQLLTFAQAREGRGVPVHPGETDLGAVARHVVDELCAAHPEHEIELVESGDLTGLWDGDRVAEVLSNLVGNAVQHGSGAPVRVRVTGEAASVAVEVENRGPPIPGDALGTLFEPFRRGAGAARRGTGGVGLGLYICRELVRAHGGTIGARSDGVGGTVFRFELPRRALAAAGSASEGAALPGAP